MGRTFLSDFSDRQECLSYSAMYSLQFLIRFLTFHRGKETAMRYFTFIILLLIASCNQDSVWVIDIPSNQEFTLKLGEQASIDNANLFVRFIDVVEDSRCPINARCIWAGNGKIALEIQKPNADKITATLNTTLQPQTAVYHSYEIQFKQLRPEPIAGSEIKPEDYRATLVVKVK